MMAYCTAVYPCVPFDLAMQIRARFNDLFLIEFCHRPSGVAGRLTRVDRGDFTT
jgi:hypothetical protein